jgi:prevent-host-death family protein
VIRVNMHEAKTQLSKLVEAALTGEEVLICRAGEPVVQLTPVAARRAEPRIPGRMRDVLAPMSKEAFAPLSAEEAAEWFAPPSKRGPGR